LNYDDPLAVAAEISPTWWLEHNSCKFILSVLVHKDNKDIATNPTLLPPGPTRSAVCAKEKQTIQKKQEATKLTHQLQVSISKKSTGSVSLSDDVEHEAKKARVDGMRSLIDKNKVEAINAQISVMRQLEDVYISRMGRNRYEPQLVNLVNQMPGMLAPQQQVDLHTPTSEPSQDQDDDIDDAFD
jgi:hypothetical protein